MCATQSPRATLTTSLPMPSKTKKVKKPPPERAQATARKCKFPFVSKQKRWPASTYATVPHHELAALAGSRGPVGPVGPSRA